MVNADYYNTAKLFPYDDFGLLKGLILINCANFYVVNLDSAGYDGTVIIDEWYKQLRSLCL